MIPIPHTIIFIFLEGLIDYLKLFLYFYYYFYYYIIIILYKIIFFPFQIDLLSVAYRSRLTRPHDEYREIPYIPFSSDTTPEKN